MHFLYHFNINNQYTLLKLLHIDRITNNILTKNNCYTLLYYNTAYKVLA